MTFDTWQALMSDIEDRQALIYDLPPDEYREAAHELEEERTHLFDKADITGHTITSSYGDF